MMSIRRIAPILAAAALLCGLVAGTPAAQAGTASPAQTTTVHVQAAANASDYVVGWININRGTPRCSFANSRNWDWVCNGFANNVSSLWNESRTRAMNFFFLDQYKGAYVCLPPTASFNDLTKIRFNKGAGLPGYGVVVNDQIMSSLWAAGSTC